VVLVSKGLEALLRFCLDSLQRALASCPRLGVRTIVVVDNGSPIPYRRSAFPAVHLLRFERGQSFAFANNAAVRAFPADFYLLLNNDVLLDPSAIADMLRTMEAGPDVGICGTRLLFPSGDIQHCGVVFGRTEGPYHVDRGRPSEVVSRHDRELQAVSGACFLVRHPVWIDLGGLDPSYPFGLEDVDFCLRARQRGWRVVCCNQTDSLHFESMTPGRVELDVPSRALFNERWQGRYAIDG
jgi:GT2 family glycosyltransferase